VERIGESPERWQTDALVEALGELRARLARVQEHHERERAGLNQKLLAAKDALSRLEANENVYGRALAQRQGEIERLKSEIARTARERDEARALLEHVSLKTSAEERELGESGA